MGMGMGDLLNVMLVFYNEEVNCFNSNNYLLIFILYWFK